MGHIPKQTVKQAIDTATGEVIEASALHLLSEEQFTHLRRLAMASSRVARRRGAVERPAFICACCSHPLYLSRHMKAQGNRWFVHDSGAPQDCVYHEGSRHTEETIRALIYRGQQEGAQHREMKEFLAHWLRRDPEVSRVDTEQTQFSSVARGEWRRPDARCIWRGIPIVFEVQLSYTFLSTVIERDEFYRREGEFIIWVFQAFDRSRAAVTDEAFFNRRNLFMLDTEAMQTTLDRELLTFSGWHQQPRVVSEHIEDVWSSRLLGLRETVFPTENFRPYYHDYAAAQLAAQARLQTVRTEQRKREWCALARRYVTAAVEYFDSGHKNEDESFLLDIADSMEDFPQWHRGFQALKDPVFYGAHGILSVLLCLKLGRVVSYRVGTVYQVLEAGLRTSGHGLRRPYTILFLRAYKHWQPSMNERQRLWLRALAHKVKASIDAGEPDYGRFMAYDEAIGLLFPELDEVLCDPFGGVSISQREAGRLSERAAMRRRSLPTEKDAPP